MQDLILKTKAQRVFKLEKRKCVSLPQTPTATNSTDCAFKPKPLFITSRK